MSGQIVDADAATQCGDAFDQLSGCSLKCERPDSHGDRVLYACALARLVIFPSGKIQGKKNH